MILDADFGICCICSEPIRPWQGFWLLPAGPHHLHCNTAWKLGMVKGGKE